WLKDGWILGEGRTLNQVRVACKIFRHAMNDDVDAGFEGSLKTGRAEGVVDDDERATSVRQAADGCDVVDEEPSISGRFEPDELGARSDGGIEGRCVREVDLADDDPDGLKNFVENAIGAA